MPLCKRIERTLIGVGAAGSSQRYADRFTPSGIESRGCVRAASICGWRPALAPILVPCRERLAMYDGEILGRVGATAFAADDNNHIER